MKNFSLDSITIKPKENEAIKKAIVLLHGYGGDGSDISMLSHNWKRHLKNTIIICPNGHERCKINPSGFQWFDLSIDDEDYILNQFQSRVYDGNICCSYFKDTIQFFSWFFW